MPRMVRVKGQTVSFPDSFSDEQIDSIIQRDFFGKPQTDAQFAAKQNEIRSGLAAQGFQQDVPPEEKTFLGGLKDSTVPSIEAVKQMGNMLGLQGGIEQARAIAQAGAGIIGAQAAQVGQARQAYGRGDIVEGMGHAMGAAVPLVGPAAAEAGNSIKEGDIGYGLGQGVGLVAQTLVPGAVGAKVERMAANAPAKIAAAEKQYGSVFGQAHGKQPIIQRRVPEMMDRGMVIRDPKGELALAAEAEAQTGKQAVNDAINNMSAPVDVNAVKARLRAAEREQFQPAGPAPAVGPQAMAPKGPNSNAVVERIRKYETEVIDPNAPSGTIPPQNARTMRKEFYEPNADTVDDAARTAHRKALQEELNSDPAVKAANTEESFWLDVKKIAETAPVSKGVTKVLTDAGKWAVGGAIGHAVPVVGQAVGGLGTMVAVVKILKELPKTPAFRTASAMMKRNYGKALQSGNYAEAARIGAGIAAGENLATNQAEQ